MFSDPDSQRTMAPVSGADQGSEKKKSRFSMKKKKKEDKTTPEKESPAPDQSANLLSPQTGSERRNSDSSSLNQSLNQSTPAINTPDTPKRKSGLNMSFRKKKKGNFVEITAVVLSSGAFLTTCNNLVLHYFSVCLYYSAVWMESKIFVI